MMTETVFCEKCNLYVLDTEGCEHLRPDAAGLREKIARIIDPELCAKYDAEKASGRKAVNGHEWAEVCYGTECKELAAKADAILALLPSDAAVKALVDAAREFVRKVDVGEARSVRSYSAFKKALYDLDNK